MSSLLHGLNLILKEQKQGVNLICIVSNYSTVQYIREICLYNTPYIIIDNRKSQIIQKKKNLIIRCFGDDFLDKDYHHIPFPPCLEINNK